MAEKDIEFRKVVVVVAYEAEQSESLADGIPTTEYDTSYAYEYSTIHSI